MTKKIFAMKSLILLFVYSFLMVSTCYAGVAVIVHPSNSNVTTEDDIVRIFLGKKTTFADGSEAIPVDQTEGSPTKAFFTQTVLNKNDQQIKAYWAQLLFTGRGVPPKSVGQDVDVKKLVAENPSLIGYIDASDVDASIKVIAEY